MDYASLFNEIIRFEIELWNLVENRLLEENQLPLTWYEPMKVISVVDNCRVNDIALALSITVGGVSKLIDRIEANGLCERRSDPSDGRSAIICLTVEGTNKLNSATQTFNKEIENSISHLVSESELKNFQEFISLWRTSIRNRISGSTLIS
ncbi:MarR family transcriptional regulator [Leptospira levettii]|uniref:MarR family winged helix-turn-helix transcriptional regulator n=1 Tax=Leptospira levettii TaxID=2023178 RepID=UPI00108379B3|nr:MarR family winged helix-turn-helix transcriptional regulator [Leptospira levettii]TGL11586.1 MarR family transcriptional regulator [Leptospira levettii]